MKAYLVGLTAAAILAALVRRLAPNNAAGKTAKMGAGLLILIAMLRPLGEADPLGAAQDLLKKGWQDPLSAQAAERGTNELLEELITDQTESYILDKAQALGLQLTAEVTTRISDYYPVPWSVRLQGTADAYQRRTLTEYISQELGIPEERQEWSDM